MIHHLAPARRLGLVSPRRRVPASRPPTLIESDYAHRLVGIVDRLRDVVTSSTTHLRFDDTRSKAARSAIERARQEVEHGYQSTQIEGLAYDFGRRVSVHQRGEFQRQAKAALGIDVTPLDPQVASLVDGFVHENAALVRKLQGSALDDLETLLTRAAADGATGEAVAEQIAARFGIAERHARLIARDQITKLESRLTQARCTEIGIASYDWVSLLVGKNRRKEHIERHGKRFRFDSPPADGHPGRAICCQCRMAPSWDDVRAQSSVPRSDSATQARDYHGRFASGSGTAHDHARVEHVRSEAASLYGHAHGEHEAHVEHAAIANEHRAHQAGHIAPLPTAKLAEYDATHARIQHEAEQRQAHLDEHQAAAAHALGAVRAHPDHEQHDIHNPIEDHEAASEALAQLAGHDRETLYETSGEHGDATFHEHAAMAQTALEALHAHQLAAIEETRHAEKEHRKAAAAMQREVDHYADEERASHGVTIGHEHPGHGDAYAAVESLAGHESSRRADISGPMASYLEDAKHALREAAGSTAKAVRELSALTGRAPKLAK